MGMDGLETVKTRFGDFEFKNGYPTPAAAEALLDQLKYQPSDRRLSHRVAGRRYHRVAARAPRVRREAF